MFIAETQILPAQTTGILEFPGHSYEKVCDPATVGWRLTAWQGGNSRHNRTPTHTAINTNASSETTPTAPSKGLRSQPRALIAIGCFSTCVQHSLLAARLSLPHRVELFVDTGGIQCVYRILYGNTCCACSSPTVLT